MSLCPLVKDVLPQAILEDRPWLGLGLEKSKRVSNELGKATIHALAAIAERSTLFIGLLGDSVYPGMVFGELTTKASAGDMEVKNNELLQSF
eukprot:scaffold284166_cov84-Attheya_sp.AAC.1